MKIGRVFKNIAFIYATSNFAAMYAQSHPNFVWFMAEDISKHHLSLYNDGQLGAKTPNVERLAKEGLVFTNAYSNAPVSSAARSTIITACYAPRLGVSFHRKIEQVPLPEGLRMFPSYLRDAGYHTSNAAKTDYNCFLDETAWDVVTGEMGEWRNRLDKNKPFFFVRTNAISHESCLHFDEAKTQETQTRYDPKDVFVQPNHPDTELFRYTYATFYDRIEDSDKELGKLIQMLEDDHELDNTFIFYFGDNGGALPGSKGYTTETGLQVPFVVYIPKKWRDKIPVNIGSKIDGFVDFIDLGPTLLHLAGIPIPKQMEGKPFLGTDISLKKMNACDEVYGYADRFDELYAFTRTLRKGKFKYSRNFQPYHPISLFAFYRYKQAAFREWQEMYKEGKLNAEQSHFFEPAGAEELYDLSVDPYETHNLANRPQFSKQLKEMRKKLIDHMVKEHDLGFYPENVWLEQGKENPTSFGEKHAADIKYYAEISNMENYSFKKGKKFIRKALQSSDPVARYWAATVCASWGEQASLLFPELRVLLNDPHGYVKSRAVVALSIAHKINPEQYMKEALLTAKTGLESLIILNDIVYLEDAGLGFHFNIGNQDVPQQCTGVDWRLDYLLTKQ